MHQPSKVIFCTLLCLLSLGALTDTSRRAQASSESSFAPASGSSAARTQHRVHPEAPPAGVSTQDWAGIRQAYEANRHRAFRVAAGYQARNPGQQWQTHFDGRGFVVQPEAGAWRWGLALRSYGFSGHARPLAEQACVTAQVGRVVYAWDETLEEWFVNDPRGLEHGFTIRARPAGGAAAGASLELRLAVRGGLRPRVQEAGGDVSFVDERGQAAINYSGLTVYDADGRRLPAQFAAAGDELWLTVDERGARYPLTIDPWAQQAYLKASNTGAADNFGFAVAISGDTVVVGATGEDSNATGVNGNQGDNSAIFSGATYVFVRSGTTWSQQAYLKASNSGAGDFFSYAVAISGDTIVVGAYPEDSSVTGVNGNQADNSALDAGAAYVFVRLIAPTISKAFSPTSIQTGGSSTVTLTLTNTNAIALTNGSFTDLLLGGLSATGGAVSGTCTSTTPALLTQGQTNLSFSGITIPALGSCTVTFAVTSTTPGTPTNQTSGVTTNQNTTPGNPSNVAQITVSAPLGPPLGPGLPFPATTEVSGQNAGSVLVYNLYSSSASALNSQNTCLSITNVNPDSDIAVHLFFVDGQTCSIADAIICLTKNQTASFLASDLDPGTTGYIVAVASDPTTGCPVNFNFLIGDAYVKLSSGHAANLGAEAFSALAGGPVACDGNSVTATLNFDGVSYNRVPRTLAASSIPARADGNDTLLIVNRFGGNLAIGAATLTNLFGIFYDDAENALSFTFNPGTCQFRSSLSNSFPRLPRRFENVVPAGRSGWMRLYSTSDTGLLGAVLNFNPNAGTTAGAFNQGRNLHKLTLTSTQTLVIPIFPPNCFD